MRMVALGALAACLIPVNWMCCALHVVRLPRNSFWKTDLFARVKLQFAVIGVTRRNPPFSCSMERSSGAASPSGLAIHFLCVSGDFKYSSSLLGKWHFVFYSVTLSSLCKFRVDSWGKMPWKGDLKAHWCYGIFLYSSDFAVLLPFIFLLNRMFWLLFGKGRIARSWTRACCFPRSRTEAPAAASTLTCGRMPWGFYTWPLFRSVTSAAPWPGFPLCGSEVWPSRSWSCKPAFSLETAAACACARARAWGRALRAEAVQTCVSPVTRLAGRLVSVFRWKLGPRSLAVNEIS